MGDVRDLWDFRSAGTIWRIIPAAGRLIVGEERDTSAKSVSYFCVSLDDGRALWKGVRPAEHWWTGIEAVHRGMIFIHEYPVPSMPDHKKIFAIDVKSGAPVWENGELSFNFAQGGAVYASRVLFDRREFFELDLRNGSVVREVSAEALAELRSSPEPEWEMDIGLPGPAETVPDPVGRAFPPGTRLEPGETLGFGGMEVSNVYEAVRGDGGEQKLREHLVVLDPRTGGITFRDIICDHLSFPAGTTFFRAEERILYVRERTTLRSFSLSPGEPS